MTEPIGEDFRIFAVANKNEPLCLNENLNK